MLRELMLEIEKNAIAGAKARVCLLNLAVPTIDRVERDSPIFPDFKPDPNVHFLDATPNRNYPRSFHEDPALDRRGNPRIMKRLWSGEQRLMKTSHLGSFASGDSLGGKVSHYRSKQNIYTQNAPAYTLFYIQEGGVRLSRRSKHRPSAVTAILGVGDFFGELCLAGYPLRKSSAITLTASSIRTIKKENMLQMLRKKNKASNLLVAYLLSSVENYQEHVADLLTFSAEQRLARVLLRLAHLDKKGPPVAEIPILSHQVLAEMVGTTRPRVNVFMNRFRKQGFIDYDGGIEVHQSLRKVLRRR